MRTRPDAPGLYLHVPFCAHRCHYCDFNVVAGADAETKRRYVTAVRADLARVAAEGPRGVAPPDVDASESWPAFGSVFVGGGTPTALRSADLAGLLRFVREALPVAADAEITVEANPETLSVDYLSELVAAGLTRVSIGAQSFAGHVLAFLGRDHDAGRPLRAVADARAAGVGVVSLDMIYGTPGESHEDWKRTLDTAVAAGADHLSAYALTVEANTVYGSAVRRNVLPAPDDDVQAERMRIADERLTDAGFHRYELSNWARPGRQCMHNLNYWQGGNWLGVGAGAHGHWEGRRWWSYRPTRRYIERAIASAPTTAGSEMPDAAERRTERLLLGLRLVEGVRRADVEPLAEARVAALRTAGLLHDDGTRLRLTPAGFPVANAVTLEVLGELVPST